MVSGSAPIVLAGAHGIRIVELWDDTRLENDQSRTVELHLWKDLSV